MIDLKDFISEDCICILKSSSKKEVLTELTQLIFDHSKINDFDKLLTSIFHREKLMSTGIGLGIAIPHVRVEGVNNPIIAVGINKNGIDDYDSIDGKTVKLIIMIVAGKHQHKEHIKLLAQIAEKLKSEDLKNKLINSNSNLEIKELLTK